MTASAGTGGGERCRLVPNFLARFAARAAGSAEALQVAVLTRAIREEFAVNARFRAARAANPKTMRATILAEVLGTRDVKSVARARRAIVHRGLLVQADVPGRESLFALDYAALDAERGRFSKWTDVELDVLELGSRGHQRALGTILERTVVAGRSEARIRLDDFGQAHSTTERAVDDLERCRIIEIERDRIRGNVYRPAKGGSFTAGRKRLATGRVLSFERFTPGVKRSNAPGVKPKSTAGGERPITTGVKRSNIEEQGRSTRPSLQGHRQGAEPASPVVETAGVALASRDPDEQQIEPGSAPPAVARIAAKLRSAGMADRPLALRVGPLILEHRDEAWLDELISASNDAKVLKPGAWLAHQLRKASRDVWWTSPRVARTSVSADEPPARLVALAARAVEVCGIGVVQGGAAGEAEPRDRVRTSRPEPAKVHDGQIFGGDQAQEERRRAELKRQVDRIERGRTADGLG